LVGELAPDAHAAIRMGALALTWATAAFCLVRGLPVLVEGWRHRTSSLVSARSAENSAGEAR
jgi:hypothetical protein